MQKPKKSHICLKTKCWFSDKKNPAGLRNTENRAGDAPKPPLSIKPIKNQQKSNNQHSVNHKKSTIHESAFQNAFRRTSTLLHYTSTLGVFQASAFAEVAQVTNRQCILSDSDCKYVDACAMVSHLVPHLSFCCSVFMITVQNDRLSSWHGKPIPSQSDMHAKCNWVQPDLPLGAATYLVPPGVQSGTISLQI